MPLLRDDRARSMPSVRCAGSGSWIGLAVVLQIAWAPFSARVFGGLPALSPEQVPERLRSDALLTLLLMAVSYSCFLWFINGTAARYLRARAEIELAHQIHQVLVPAVSTTHRRVRVRRLLRAERRGRRRSRRRRAAVVASAFRRQGGRLVRLRRRRLGPRRLVGRRDGHVQECAPHAPAAGRAAVVDARRPESRSCFH